MDSLIVKYQELWDKSTTHALTNELATGELSIFTLFVYLKQDFKFFDHGTKFLGKTISCNDDAKINILLGKQMGFICADENTYFVNVLAELLKQLALAPADLQTISDMSLPSVAGYNNYMQSFIDSNTATYPELITVWAVMENSYLGWANKALSIRDDDNLPWWFNEWIVLHSGDDFEKWCKLLRDEVDRYYPYNTTKMELAFKRTVELEIGFFDDCYNFKI